MGKYGEYNPDGSVKFEADECILTERKLDPPYTNTVRYSVKGTNQFFRILSSQHYQVTPDMLREWRNEDTPPVEESFNSAVGVVRNKKGRESFNEPTVGGFGAGEVKND